MTHLTNLEDFPPLDILHHIVDFLTDDRSTLASFILVCKGFHQAVTPRLWRKIDIHYDTKCSKAAEPNHFPVLDILAKNESPYSQHVRELIISCQYTVSREEALKPIAYVNQYNAALAQVLKNCKNLEKFHLESLNDFTFYHSLKGLGDLKRIKDISLKISPSSIPPCSEETEWDEELMKEYNMHEGDFSLQLVCASLTTLEIDCAISDWSTTGECLAMTIGRSPNLITLKLAIQIVECVMPETIAEYSVGDLEQAWKRICITYPLYAREGGMTGSRVDYPRLTLKNLTLGDGFPLVKPFEEEGNYMEKMLDLKYLESFSHEETILCQPDGEGYCPKSHWDILLPATNLKRLTVQRITKDLFSYLVNGRVFQFLQRFRVTSHDEYDDRELWRLLKRPVIREEGSSLRSLTYCTPLIYFHNTVPLNFRVLLERFGFLESLEFCIRESNSTVSLLKAMFDVIHSLSHLKVFKLFSPPHTGWIWDPEEMWCPDDSPPSNCNNLKTQIEESMNLHDSDSFPILKLVKLDDACYEISEGILQSVEGQSLLADASSRLTRSFKTTAQERFEKIEIDMLPDEWLR